MAADLNTWFWETVSSVRRVSKLQFKVFYSLQDRKDEVDSTAPVPMELSDVREDLLPRVREEGDSLGLIDSNGTTLQMKLNPGSEYWIEIPVPEEEGSFGRQITLEEIESLFQSMPEEFDVDCIDSLDFHPN